MTDRQYRTWLAWFALVAEAMKGGGESEPAEHRGDDPEAIRRALRKFKTPTPA
jgi:hypothetical protein